MKRKRVVVAGAGFGGLKAALHLSGRDEFDVTLISTQLNFEYHAALYRSATGWSPREVMIPLRDIFHGQFEINIVQDKVVGIDPKKKIVRGEIESSYKYDYLILGIGQVANYYGIEGLDTSSYSMDTVANTIALREHLKDLVLNGKKKEDYRFVVVGGGATGVELASELQVFINEVGKAHHKRLMKINVVLVEGSPRVLSLLSPKVSRLAQTRLEELGVKLMLDTQVTGLKGGVLTLGNGKKIKSSTVIWSAGAKNNPFFTNNSEHFKIARNTKVEVDEFLAANKDVYVIGDSASTQYSGMAQTALFDGEFVAENLVRQANGKAMKMYVPHRPIFAVPVGPKWAIVQWGSVVVWSRLAWIMRRLADLRLFMNFEPYEKAVKTWRAGNRRARGYEIK